MFGQFTRIGKTVFPGGGQIPCGVYEWRYGTFSVRFVSPDSTPPLRRYFVQPLLEQWMAETETRFLEEACDYGYRIVAALNHHGPEQRQLYRLLAWLFRNRNAGHMAVTREFMYAQDFVDFSVSPPTLLTPEIGLDQTEVRWADLEIPAIARRMLKEAFAALRENGMDLPTLTPDFHGVREVYERFVQAPSRGGQGDSVPLPQVEETERWAILPLLATRDPQTNFNGIENDIAGSLIYGPTTIQEDRAATETHLEEFGYLWARLLRPWVQEGVTPEQLDAWLRRTRDDGYVRLIQHGRQLSEYDRLEARELARQMMRTLTWWAYRATAHCYGVLMSVIASDLMEAEHQASPLEGLLFRLEHCQMDFLAGLPLDFLGRGQFRWIVRVWQKDVLTGLARAYAEGQPFNLDTLLQIPQLLGIYTALDRGRRDADRRIKELEKAPGETSFEGQAAPAQDEAEDPDEEIRRKTDVTTHPEYITDSRGKEAWEEVASTDLGEPIMLTSLRCPVCRESLQCDGDEPIDVSNPDQPSFWGFCRRCDTRKRYVVDLLSTRLSG